MFKLINKRYDEKDEENGGGERKEKCNHLTTTKSRTLIP